ncbi:MAG: nucleotidyltransferase domain-containing protein [Thermodesulfobacteriota bacterium]
MNVKDVLQEFKERLRMVYKDNLKEVILYGSVARGDYTEESDIDVLVVLGEIVNFDEEFNKIFEIKRETERKYDDEIMISTIPTTENEYHSRFTPLFLNIRKEGIPI